ncbi:hypothetical protein BJ508DRAFT_62845 [Ascobolus immersus RN42]|uniref:Uncharacterized protein n=1 Tax=Ascobolus immersus RN42 TaxID=1160509 RepID=A0A3N4ITN2_ASCIM|nr:hypothetical protein BJ508DRAFT_62845 [Ascobolus immersus RN42]
MFSIPHSPTIFLLQLSASYLLFGLWIMERRSLGNCDRPNFIEFNGIICVLLARDFKWRLCLGIVGLSCSVSPGYHHCSLNASAI